MRSRIATLLFPALLLALPLYTSAQWTPDPWNGMVTVCDDSSDADLLKMIRLPSGNTVIGWNYEYEYPLYRIRYQMLDINGNILLPPNGIHLIEGEWTTTWTYGGFLPDGEGGCIVIFEDCRDSFVQIYGQRLDNEGNKLWGDDGLPLALNSGHELGIRDIVADSAGNFFVCLSDNIDYYTIGALYLYVQKFDRDGNRLWGEYGAPLCTYPDEANWPQAVPDGEGGLLAVWEDGREGYYVYYMYTQHLNGAGMPLLPENGIRIDFLTIAPETVAGIYQGVPDGDGGGIWAFEGPGYSSKLNVFRISGDGRTVWDWTSGVNRVYWYRSMIRDSEDGSVWLSVSDDRTGNDIVYLYRFSTAGQPLFGNDGLPYGGFLTPTLGGVIAVKNIRHLADYTISAQSVNREGQLIWETAVALSGAYPYNCWTWVITSDGYGGAVVGIYDDRIDPYETDIAAQRVCWDGSLAWTQYAPPVQQRSLDAELTLIGSTLHYTLPEADNVTLELYDILGRRVNILEQGYLPSGSHVVHLSNQNLPTGIYLLHLSTPTTHQAAKIVIVR